MRFRYESLAFGLFVLTMTNLSAARCCPPKPLEPMGVTSQPPCVITPPQAPRVPCGVNVILTADFIYWKAESDNYQYAVSGVPMVGADRSTPVPPSKRGTTAYPGFDFQPGFKVGAGVKFAHDGWDLYTNYTWLNPANLKSSKSDPAGDMVGFPDAYYGAPTLSKATCRFTQSFNVIDLELGRRFFLSKFLTLRPYFGAKTAWISQRERFVYIVANNATNGLGVNATSVPFGDTITQLHQKMKLRSWGIGIRGGIAPVWYFMKDFGLYGNLAVSGMWTQYRNVNKTAYSGTMSGLTSYISSSTHSITPVVELGLGLTYIARFYDEAYALTVSGGWEQQMWIGFNGGRTGGAMTLQGLTLQVGFEF